MNSPDSLEEIVELFEIYSFQNEIIEQLEGLLPKHTHVIVFTQLALLYCRHQQDKLTEFIRNYFQKLNI